MCYSAMVWQDYYKYVGAFGADISIKEFVRLYKIRGEKGGVIIPRGMDAAVARPRSPDEFEILTAINQRRPAEEARLREVIAVQTARLESASAKLAIKPTKSAANDVRVATKKIHDAQVSLADLSRTSPSASDCRIFSRHYAPVMVIADGKRLVRPMRYLLRPFYATPEWDRDRQGAYNARRDSLATTWRGVFGVTHGVVAAQRFYEHVDRGGRDVILEFEPADHSDMLVACLWSTWRGTGGEELTSFAFITDEPPPEVAAAGHDRCPIPLKAEHIDAWLTPQGRSPEELFGLLDDRHRPFYEHREAA
ncbi:MAG TPA: SOS response-associated peptidase family protein [Tahibacter sp.]|uniref:SOS response-associated peptidase family protein n=1 Tax=Tahibacter sp. TaxID=2056211 RepID=UPI002BA8BA9F|nr:SOS response-associated peptidase family protein [Tahibacter sp.]HSX62244.1 SOS response-associated peptidase family protein [Tahibacter sp.]